MSKRIYSSINKFLIENEEDFNMDQFLKLLNKIIVKDPISPADKTIATRYSLVKKFLRDKFASYFSEDDLRNIRPSSDVINRIINKDKINRENKTDILFTESDIEKILNLENSKNLFDKFIYLQFISGRRVAEIKEPKYLMKLSRGNQNSIKMNLAKKNVDNRETLFLVNLTPDTLSGKEFRNEVNKVRMITEDISTSDHTKRLNSKIRKLFPGKNFHSHTLRGLSAVWNYEKNNPNNLSRNPYIMKYLNQDVLDSSMFYSNYKLVDEKKEKEKEKEN